MHLLKEFFYFTKSKLIVFILLAIVIFFDLSQQDMLLGNFTWSGFASILTINYLFLNILWFSFKDKKHFLIGLVSFILLVGAVWLTNYYSTQKRAEAYDNCLKENNSTGESIEVMQCMSAKGYKYYR